MGFLFALPGLVFKPPNGLEGQSKLQDLMSGGCCEEQWLTPSWFYLADILGPRGVLAPCQLFILPVTLCNRYRLRKQGERGKERMDSLGAMSADWDQVIEFHLTIVIKKVPVLHSRQSTVQFQPLWERALSGLSRLTFSLEGASNLLVSQHNPVSISVPLIEQHDEMMKQLFKSRKSISRWNHNVKTMKDN